MIDLSYAIADTEYQLECERKTVAMLVRALRKIRDAKNDLAPAESSARKSKVAAAALARIGDKL